MLGSMNDAYILQISFVHQKITYQQLFQLDHGEFNIKPYILNDK